MTDSQVPDASSAMSHNDSSRVTSGTGSCSGKLCKLKNWKLRKYYYTSIADRLNAFSKKTNYFLPFEPKTCGTIGFKSIIYLDKSLEHFPA